MWRGEIWWASLPDPLGSGPGYRRPVVVIQSDPFNESRINTVIVAVITSNLSLAAAPGNILLERNISRLSSDSVVNVSQVLTVDKTLLTELIGNLPDGIMSAIDDGLRLVMDI
ncbi:MAG: type II toxin-antitoxin system PemK/MazF family toxin [Chloroflexi bacterium]|nr:type II toxin-antitoxin system PemK/MazF family toxin [Chloroflexota bacterium]